jgi:hypothetical protein
MKVFISAGRGKLRVKWRLNYFHVLIIEERQRLCTFASYFRKVYSFRPSQALVFLLRSGNQNTVLRAPGAAKLKIPVFPKSFRLWHKAYILIHNN